MTTEQISVLVCGNYGYRTNQIDGQTIKTRVLKEVLTDALGEINVKEVDSSYFTRFPLRFFKEAKRGFNECKQIIILPGQRGLQLFLPFFLYWNKERDCILQYVVIGGWLPPLLEKRSWLRFLCKKIDGIYVETATMAKRLSRLGLSNVKVMPNFRKFDRARKRNPSLVTKTIRLVFYSRIMREKGIEEAIAALKLVNSVNPNHPSAILDVYGPIADGYEHIFESLIKECSHANYLGILPPEHAYDILEKYNLMLFPTFYEGEGFPGTVVDAFISGLPVVATDWKYNREIIEAGKTGVLCKPKSVEDLAAKINQFISKPFLITEMSENCILKANEFHSDHAIGLLLDRIRS